MKISSAFVKILFLTAFLFFLKFLPAFACDGTTITITSQVNNGNGTYAYTLNICFGKGCGAGCLTTGGTADTDNWSLLVSGAGVTIASFTPSVTCSNTGSVYNGALVSTTQVVYSGPGVCACITSACGPIGTACQTVMITTNGLPTSIQLRGGEQNSAASPPANGACPAESVTPVAVPVPIELLKFDAVCSNNKVKLNWATASETNNDYFTVERSINGKNFEIITSVAGSNNSSQLSEYTVTDQTEIPAGEIYFYRLKQTDLNNGYKYFTPIAVKSCNKSANFFIAAYPNSASGNIDFTCISDEESESIISIVSVTGELKYRQKFPALKGLNTIKVNLEKLNRGLYIAVLTNSSQVLKTKFVKQ